MTPITTLPALLLAGLFGFFAGDEPQAAGPETVPIPAGEIAFRPFGSFSFQGKTHSPAPVPTRVEGFEIMKHQVTRAEFSACVAARACSAEVLRDGNQPQTHVNFHEAEAYARWLSEVTGETWRLPTEPEWQRAAAERYGDATPEEGDYLDPGERMLAQYERGILLRGSASKALRPAGGFGENSMGVADMSGNVWEWTTGCMDNGTLDGAGRVVTSTPYCTVRIAGGRHRAAIIDFVRDPQVGGCAVGLPPDYLGFRLVRED
ncbi:SUMF1/EgtB/PvdO family nonheme iron enzyme [Maritimibacter sp. DP1N21-5]|uniref:formylglycine-generating enzyme family protein n=1 Tax=Maritimibacter sp. DP1N21-5 TaxID=2836867 RepID=UPI001C4675CE|nr:SUMF1/EgtB/PvdO family nonheme iron enzyme [Maritimibacter sp. DP1N21-5]MBV7410071.1 formylglycine-generating enzyme family protein [Maritimibacter sp. DP1N21-5]